MALITKPSMKEIWASGGDIVEPTDLKKQQGWTVEVPPHQYENWIQNRQDEYLAHINQRGIPAWDSTTDYEAGGLSYAQGSNGTIYRSVAASGPATVIQDPTTDGVGTYWEEAFAGGGGGSGGDTDTVRVDVASATTVNLTSSAPATRNINITGTTTITGFTVAAGLLYFVRFNGVLTLANNAAIVTQSGGNILTAAGDTCVIRATATDTVEVLNYVSASMSGRKAQANTMDTTAGAATIVGAFGWGGLVSIGDATNANMPVSGSYKTANTGANLPAANTLGYHVIRQGNGTFAIDTAYSYDTGAMWTRTNQSGVLGAWQSITVGANAGLGVGQTWQNFNGSRASATTYTNSTGRTILVAITVTDPNAGQNISPTAYIDGNIIARLNLDSAANVPRGSLCLTVPAGSTYRVDYSGGNDALDLWWELR